MSIPQAAVPPEVSAIHWHGWSTASTACSMAAAEGLLTTPLPPAGIRSVKMGASSMPRTPQTRCIAPRAAAVTAGGALTAPCVSVWMSAPADEETKVRCWSQTALQASLTLRGSCPSQTSGTDWDLHGSRRCTARGGPHSCLSDQQTLGAIHKCTQH